MSKKATKSEPGVVVVSPATEYGRWVRCDPCGESYLVPANEQTPVCPRCGQEG